MRELELRVLGSLEVTSAGAEVELGAPRQRALLALLALNANRVVPRDRIVDALWGDDPPRTARNALQVAVHGLRKALGADRVETRGEGYRLALAEGELDLERFGRLVERAEREGPTDAATTLREALTLHRGTALADLPDAPFVTTERERIEELRLLALERRIDADLAQGRHNDLVPELEPLVSEHPYRDRFLAQLMLTLYRSGRQADALEAFRQARTALVEELGLEPSAELQDLHARILRHDEGLDVGPAARPPTNLRLPSRALIGRELELAAVAALLRSAGSRLVTLTGAGGTGKTRLALEVASELLDELAGGVHVVDLAPLQDPALVGPMTARVLGIRDEDDEQLVPRIAAAVGGRETLLVLDNVEHVLGSAAPFVADLLANVRPLRVLATSREPLRIGAEQEYRVPPLALPVPGVRDLGAIARSEAVALFVARVEAVQHDFALTRENAEAVVGICRTLDALPLALELAAPRVRILSPEALLHRLENRLGVLEGGDRDLPDRQRTLRAAIDWSYELLERPERALFERLSVFAGGWTLAAAEAACDADLTLLGSLVEKSLVAVHPTASDPRFFMLETVREYALDRLARSGQAVLIRDRHAQHFASLAERLEPELQGREALDEVEREHDNVRAALGHTLAHGDAGTALRLCTMARFWYVRGYGGEGHRWLERVLALEGGSPERRAVALGWSGTLAWTAGDYATAIARAGESLELAQSIGDVLGTARALTTLGLAHFGARDLAASRAYYTQGLELARELGRERDVALSLSNLADVAFVLGDLPEAEALAGESLEVARRLGDLDVAGVALLLLASCALERARPADARPLVVESLRSFRAVGFQDYIASSLVALARVEAPTDAERAARLLGAARTLREPLGPSQFPWEQAWFESTLDVIRAAIGDQRTDDALAEGSSAADRTIDEALARHG